MTTVSVVMGVYNDGALLRETVQSVLSQEGVEFEFVIVDDGSTDSRTVALLDDYTKANDRIQLIRQPNQGLTRALIAGCSAASGTYIARIDAGDAMLPGRLAAQVAAFERHATVGFLGCLTEICGPAWEPMWLSPGRPRLKQPIRLVDWAPTISEVFGVPHHGAMMIRRDAYQAVGGYRAPFYFAQDLDLWLRLGEWGEYYELPQLYYRCRILPGGISMSRRTAQERFGRLARDAALARAHGETEAPFINEAQMLTDNVRAENGRPRRRSREPGMYFVGEALRRRGDRRCRQYLLAGIKAAPLRPRGYWRLAQSLLLRASDAVMSDTP